MTIVFTMTSRMMAIAGACALLFCVTLFLLGMQIGTRYGHPASHLAGTALPSPGTDTLSTHPVPVPVPGATADSAESSGTSPPIDPSAPSPAGPPSFSSDTSKP